MYTVEDLTTIVYSGEIAIDALQDASSPWNFLLPYRNTLYYTFDAGTGSYIDDETATPLTAFNIDQQKAAIAILGHASALTGINFVQVQSSVSADIHFAATDLAGTKTTGLSGVSFHYTHNKGNLVTLSAEATVWLDNAEFSNSNGAPTPGSPGYETLLHEIGHILGLGHPFNNPNALPKDLDNTNHTVMSYNSEGGYKSTFQPFDIAALNWIYGGDGLGGAWGYNSANGFFIDSNALDVTAPTLVNFSSSKVGDKLEIQLNFSESVNRGTGNITLKAASGEIVAIVDAATSNAIALTNSSLTVTFTNIPNGGRDYALEIDAGSVSDIAGNPLDAIRDYTFKTQDPTDHNAPQILGFSTGDGDSANPLNRQLQITFNEAVELGEGSILLWQGGKLVAEWNVSIHQGLNIAGNILTLDLPEGLNYNTDYTLDIPDGFITDLSGNILSDDILYAFTTPIAPDITPPSAIHFGLANEDIGEGSCDIFVLFSEIIKVGSGSISLHTASGVLVENFDVRTSSHILISGNQLLLSPTVMLEHDVEYNLAFQSGSIADLSGNTIPAINFSGLTTSASTIPTDDYSDDLLTLGEISVGGQTSGKLEAPGDTDWFKITLNAEEKYEFELFMSGNPGKSGLAQINLYDSEGTLLTSACEGGASDSQLFRYSPDASGTFYLAVNKLDPNSNLTGSYSLKASITDDNFPTGDIVLVGDIAVGNSLSVDTSRLADLDGLGELTFQWLRNGHEITGANSNTYSLGFGDLGNKISAVVRYVDGEGFEESIRSNPASVITHSLSSDDIPLLSGGLSEFTDIAIQQVFVGLLGRPVKASGEAYWQAQVDADNGFGLPELMSNIVNEQPEYINAFADLNREESVTLHFNYLFSRDPTFDANGNNYWVDGAGAEIPTNQLVLALLLGSQGEDIATLSNKMCVANHISDNTPILASPAGVEVLGMVNYDIDSVASALKAVDLFA